MNIIFETEPELIDILPHPKPASKFVPDWYKNINNHINTDIKLDRYVEENGDLKMNMTVKKCIPVRDALTSGYIIPLWSDIAVYRNNEQTHFTWQAVSKEPHYNWHKSNKDSLMNLQGHPLTQFINTPLEKFSIGEAIWKFESPWKIVTPPGYSCIFLPPLYHDNYFEILPGVVDTDIMHSIHYPFKYIGPQGTYNVLTGTPLIKVIPFKRVEWTSEVRANSGAQSKFDYKFLQNFGNVYRDYFHSKKVYR